MRNVSSEAWRPAEGFAVGYHIFDPETGTLVVDGPRTAPPADIAPGEAQRFELQLDLPPEPGRYRIFVSGVQEQATGCTSAARSSCWWTRWCGGTRKDGEFSRGYHRFGAAREVSAIARRAFTLPFDSIVRNRSLIRTMVRRDVLGRYRGSFGGAFWTVLNPLILMLTYFFVFGVVLHARFPNDPSRAGFALYFLAGMLPWLPVSEAAGRSPTVMLEHRNFVKKLVFPVETLPVNLVTAGLVSEVFGVALFLVASYLVRGYVPSSIVWLPLLLVPQILLTAGLCWFLAALGVFVRDLAQINGFLLTLWFFLTPICYPEARCPARLCGSFRRIRCSYWCADIARCSRAARRRSRRTGSCAWLQWLYSSSATPGFTSYGNRSRI